MKNTIFETILGNPIVFNFSFLRKTTKIFCSKLAPIYKEHKKFSIKIKFVELTPVYSMKFLSTPIAAVGQVLSEYDLKQLTTLVAGLPCF